MLLAEVRVHEHWWPQTNPLGWEFGKEVWQLLDYFKKCDIFSKTTAATFWASCERNCATFMLTSGHTVLYFVK